MQVIYTKKCKLH